MRKEQIMTCSRSTTSVQKKPCGPKPALLGWASSSQEKNIRALLKTNQIRDGAPTFPLEAEAQKRAVVRRKGTSSCFLELSAFVTPGEATVSNTFPLSL